MLHPHYNFRSTKYKLFSWLPSSYNNHTIAILQISSKFFCVTTKHGWCHSFCACSYISRLILITAIEIRNRDLVPKWHFFDSISDANISLNGTNFVISDYEPLDETNRCSIENHTAIKKNPSSYLNLHLYHMSLCWVSNLQQLILLNY